VLVQAGGLATCSTTAGFQFVVAGGWHSAFAGVLASIVFVAIVFVLTNEIGTGDHQREREGSLRVLFITFFVFLLGAFLWATVAGFPETAPVDGVTGRVHVAVQPVLAVPAAWLLSIGAVLLFFAITWLVSTYERHRGLSSSVSTTALHCFRLIAWLTAVEVWIAIETATRGLAGRGWWYSPVGVVVVTVAAVPFVFGDRIAARIRRPPGGSDASEDGRLGTALGVVGASAVVMVVFFAAVTGQPDSAMLREGNWCGQGLPWWAALAAVATMALFLVSIAALAGALPTRDASGVEAPPAAHPPSGAN
jgi:hypothetical protein